MTTNRYDKNENNYENVCEIECNNVNSHNHHYSIISKKDDDR